MRFRKEHVEEAFGRIRREGFLPNRDSTKWDILDPVTGERFPPKAVLRIAKELADDASWSGGGGPQTNGPLRERGFDILLKVGLEESEAADDIRQVLGSTVDETTKERLINARLGQGGFREALLEIWDRKCALTGCNITEVLRASHIKPWRDSNDVERLDPVNGVLLAASIDALFDKFLVTFNADGMLEFAADQNATEIERLGVRKGQKVYLSPENQVYMKWHREMFVEKAKARNVAAA
jgi:putative restriction endonuclease